LTGIVVISQWWERDRRVLCIKFDNYYLQHIYLEITPQPVKKIRSTGSSALIDAAQLITKLNGVKHSAELPCQSHLLYYGPYFRQAVNQSRLALGMYPQLDGMPCEDR